MHSITKGDLVKDLVTGFEGIFTGEANYLHGDRQIQITGITLDSDGRIREEWFNASRVVAAQ